LARINDAFSRYGMRDDIKRVWRCNAATTRQTPRATVARVTHISNSADDAFTTQQTAADAA